MRMLVLYTELMGYTAKTLSVLATEYNVDVTVICKDANKKTPYTPKDQERLRYLGRSQFDRRGLLELFMEKNPDLIYIAGWVDKDYLTVARAAKRKKIPVITGIDNQWRGDIRQRMACCFSSIFIHRYFDYVQVPSRLQYEYARRLGFHRQNILMNMYSADTDLFAAGYQASRETKNVNYPHRFIFVGRLHPNKGLDILLQAWEKLCATINHDWDLMVIGNGPLEKSMKRCARVSLKGFLQPTEIAAEAINAGAFILPSRKEPWGVVVHEFTAAGLPLILSDVCGAAAEFLIPGFNGFSFASENVADLCRVLSRMVRMDDKTLARMGERSYELSHRITPLFSVASLLTPIFQNQYDV